MGFMANLAKLGVAKKAYDQFKKPENQAKMKNAMSSAKTKASSAKTKAKTRGRTTPPTTRQP